MELGKALAASLVAHPFILLAILVANFPGEEAVMHVGDPILPDTPSMFRICPEPPLEEDVEWAVNEWNRAFKAYGVPIRLQVASDNCTARVKPTDSPLQGEFGGTVEVPPREGVDPSTVKPYEIRFWMLGEFQVTVWAAENAGLRRAIILHELGHVLFLGHIYDYRGFGPRPVMMDQIDPDNPTTQVTDMDAYLAWLKYSFCREKACGLIHVRMVNPVIGSSVAVSVSAAMAAVLVKVGRRHNDGVNGEG